MNQQEYWNKWPQLPKMSVGSTSNLFGNGMASHEKPLVTRRAMEMLPGVKSFDPRYLNFMRELSHKLNDAIPIVMDDRGFTTNGVFSTFDKLRTVPGYMMNPMSYMMKHNASYRKDLGLQPGYNAVQRQIAINVWRLVLGSYKPSPIKITKKSAGGVRRNTSDHEWKYAFCEYVFDGDHLETILDLIEKGDWLELANTFEMVFMMYVQKRDQVDTPGKERIVFDLMYALTNGEQGRAFAADKRVVILGQEWADFSATRARVINAGPWVINCVLSMMFTGHMQAMFENYPLTWHVNTEDEIVAGTHGKHIYCGDVKEYDRSMPEEAIDVFHEVLAEFWDPRLSAMSASLYYSAYYSRPLALKGTEGVMVGDFTKFKEKQVVAGNRSGHAATSLIAKTNKVIETLYLFHVMGLRVVGNEHSFLKGKEAIGVINNGDDEVIHSRSAELMESFRAVRASLEHSVYIVTPEDGQVYSGKVLMVDKFGGTRYTPVPRLSTAFEKIYNNERPIGGLFRPQWHIGVIERMNSRDAHPLGGVAWEVHDELFHNMMAPHFGSLFSMLSEAITRSGMQFDGLSAADRDVLDKPSRIYYKYKDGVVSKKVLETIAINFPYAGFEHVVKARYRGNLI